MIDLKQGDCLELMKDIPDKSVDMILADLPYGKTASKWDKVIDSDKMWEQYKRIITNHGAIVLFGIEPFSSMLRTSNLNMYRYDWVWQKTRGSNLLNAKRMPLRSHENISVFYKHLPTYNPQMRKGFKPYKMTQGYLGESYSDKNSRRVITNNKSGDRYPLTVIKFAKDNTKIHPTQKPVKLLKYLIRTYTNKGDTVLDNCMGSGSTGVACVDTKRNFIGYELDQEYFNIAKKRINDAKTDLV